MENQYFRFYVKVRCILNISPINIYNELKSAFGNEAPSHKFIVKWSKSFKAGKNNVKNAVRLGDLERHLQMKILIM
jgi:hypothetical protein